jgi:hypothetical protein
VGLFVRAEVLERMARKREFRGQAFVGLIGPRILHPPILALLMLLTDFLTTLTYISISRSFTPTTTLVVIHRDWVQRLVELGVGCEAKSSKNSLI